MPGSQVTRQRVIDRSTCILGFTGNQFVKSFVFDATSLTADANGFYFVPAFSFVTKAVASDPTKIKVYQGLGSNVNAVQHVAITGSPTGGTFTLTFNGQTTAAIAYDATSTAVAAALTALDNIGTGNVTVSGGALPTQVVITFAALLGDAPQSLFVANGTGLTGGTTPAVTVTSATTGQTAETICGVFDNLDYDFFGNAVGDDEPVPVYDQYTAFDTTLLNNWFSFGVAAKAALPTCTFQP